VASTAAGIPEVVITNGLVVLVIVTAVLACAEAAATLLAVIVIEAELPVVGAVNKPAEEMVPALADQETAVLLVLLTAALNWSLPPAATDGSSGEIWTVTGLTLVMVTGVLACAVVAATLLAVIVIDLGLPVVGAVNKPVEEIVPALADQLTAVLLVLLTAALNWTFPPAATDGSRGEIWTVIGFPLLPLARTDSA
jgi:hypothetical protein